MTLESTFVLVGGLYNAGGPHYLKYVTEYGEDGLVGELPTLNTARYGAACGAVGQVRRVMCSAISI